MTPESLGARTGCKARDRDLGHNLQIGYSTGHTERSTGVHCILVITS